MIDQIGIVVFSITAAWLSQDSRESYRKYACIIGLIGQPFWFVSSYQAEQWGVFISSIFFTAIWIRGFYNNCGNISGGWSMLDGVPELNERIVAMQPKEAYNYFMRRFFEIQENSIYETAAR